MLMALLYCDHDRIAAAALACDQMPYGDAYWEEVFAGHIETGADFETAYIFIHDPDVRKKLLLLGIEDDICGRELASEIESKLTPAYLPVKAA